MCANRASELSSSFFVARKFEFKSRAQPLLSGYLLSISSPLGAPLVINFFSYIKRVVTKLEEICKKTAEKRTENIAVAPRQVGAAGRAQAEPPRAAKGQDRLNRPVHRTARLP